jgi:polysaccharide biosynthesis/export protein
VTKGITGWMSVTVLLALSGCSSINNMAFGPELLDAEAPAVSDYEYRIGPGDSLSIFVWRNPDVSTSVPVRPDGKITAPLLEDLPAAGRTSTELARDIEKALSEYIRDPLVTVTVGGFQGEFAQTIRVVGEAAKPQSIPYRSQMTALDVMIAVGGLTTFADGNSARVVRQGPEGPEERRVRLEDLVRDGDISANVQMAPGDILIIPEAWF